MPLIYKPVKAAVPDKEGKKKWHLTLVKTGIIVDTQQLAETLARESTLSVGDVHNVIRNLMSAMKRELLNSNSVRLDGLGTFTMYARTTGNGVDTREEVGPEQITSLLCHFTPEYSRPTRTEVVRSITDGVKFVHVDQFLKKTSAESTNSRVSAKGSDGNGDEG